MRNYALVIMAALAVTGVQAQELSVNDAVRLAQDNLSGTARFRAMSGAFGALGGDLSSISVNPAGSSVFAGSQIGLTLTSYNPKNTSKYFGTGTSDNYSSFDLNQAGGVFVFNNHNSESKLEEICIICQL